MDNQSLDLLITSAAEGRNFIMALFHHENQRKTRWELEVKLQQSQFNSLLHFWLKVGLVDADDHEVWLTREGKEAVEQYRLLKQQNALDEGW